MTLHEFLALPHRFRWSGLGGDNCITWCATWASEITGIDPAEDLRGTFSDAAGADKIISAAGGVVSFMDGRLKPIGFVRVDDPHDGDIAAVKAPAGIHGDIIGAIRFGPLWAMMAPAGVIARKLEHVAAWRLNV
ncbi:hypothetical protein EHH54_31820 [Rhizobium leguminosarum]|uniref:DUF6950 family protein n=1 Tax=Rhizobium leguminosarum TaxID=384 RepID=UPI000FEC358B|nr:hypothetical protein [Rhizobium leguminosarum]RWX28964.1 hypothetical protein EHH54_31820 [Rhizobium leguminosarum]